MQDFIKIHSGDNVAVALKPLASGTTVTTGAQTITLISDIPQGPQFALTDIAEGASVIKYGCAIGLAKEPILKGSWIHTHNLKTCLLYTSRCV